MAKKIDLSGLRKRPVKKKAIPQDLEDKVVSAIHKEGEKPEKEPLKRVTLDLPASLHTRLKLRVVHDETTIRSFLIEVLEQILD